MFLSTYVFINVICLVLFCIHVCVDDDNDDVIYIITKCSIQVIEKDISPRKCFDFSEG